LSKRVPLKTCFVVCPIGEEGSDERFRSDQLLRHLLRPAARKCGYKTVRADHISKPGLITHDIIEHLVEDPLVIADLAGANPNVFYELAVRHATKKPVIQITQVGEAIPFDVSPVRTIRVNHRDPNSVEACQGKLIQSIRAVERYPKRADNPISVTMTLLQLRKSSSLVARSNATVLTLLHSIRDTVSDVSEAVHFQVLREKQGGTLMEVELSQKAFKKLDSDALKEGITVQELTRRLIRDYKKREESGKQSEEVGPVRFIRTEEKAGD